MARFRTSCVASGQRNAVPCDGAADQANVAEGQKRTNHHGLKSTFVRFGNGHSGSRSTHRHPQLLLCIGEPTAANGLLAIGE